MPQNGRGRVQSNSVPWGAFVYTLIEFFLVLLTLYALVKLFKLDKLRKLDKK